MGTMKKLLVFIAIVAALVFLAARIIDGGIANNAAVLEEYVNPQ